MCVIWFHLNVQPFQKRVIHQRNMQCAEDNVVNHTANMISCTEYRIVGYTQNLKNTNKWFPK